MFYVNGKFNPCPFLSPVRETANGKNRAHATVSSFIYDLRTALSNSHGSQYRTSGWQKCPVSRQQQLHQGQTTSQLQGRPSDREGSCSELNRPQAKLIFLFNAHSPSFGVGFFFNFNLRPEKVSPQVKSKLNSD